MTFGGVEALLIPWYAAHLPARIVSETPADLQTQVPLVQLVGVGGSADRSAPNRFRTIRWVLHSFAADAPATALLAEQANSLTLGALRGAVLSGAAVTMTDVVSAPAWVGYADPNVRQYVASYSAQILLG